MCYYDRNSQDKAAQGKAGLYRTIAACYPVFADVVRTFDDKVFNCKLEDALNAAFAKKFGVYTIDGHDRDFNNVCIHVQKESQWIDFLIYTRHHNDGYSIAFLKKDDLKDGKRIPADKIIKSAQEKRERFLQAAAQLEKDMEQVEFYRAQISQINAMLKTVVDGIGYDARQIYGLDYYVRRH